MKGKYITTSLILAILGNGRNGSVEVAETIATTEGHELIWTRATSVPERPVALSLDRDELKQS